MVICLDEFRRHRAQSYLIPTSASCLVDLITFRHMRLLYYQNQTLYPMYIDMYDLSTIPINSRGKNISLSDPACRAGPNQQVRAINQRPNPFYRGRLHPSKQGR